MLALPGPHHGLKILVAADDHACIRNIHSHSQRIGPVEAAQSLLLDNIAEALSDAKILAKLQPLLHN